MTDEKIAELRQATQEANQALKDLKQARKEVKELLETGVKDLLEEQVSAQLGVLETATKQAVDNATDRVYARFDKLAKILLGEDSKRKPSLEELAMRNRKAEGE